jgi:hypothetical protein
MKTQADIMAIYRSWAKYKAELATEECDEHHTEKGAI